MRTFYDILALRCRVFILEQGAYQDPDGADRQAWHLQGRDAAGVLQAYLRAVDPGIKYAEPSIGRIITTRPFRGTGVGRKLVALGLEEAERLYPAQAIRISAQAHLQRFYGEFGFVTDSAEYLEDGIPHVEMLRAPRG